MSNGSFWLELSRSALKKNIRFLRRHIGNKARMSSVVKGNAYGHGISHFVPMVEACGVDHFCVFNAEEASRVLAACHPETEIVIMGDVPDDELPWAIEAGIGFFVFDLRRLDAAIRAARRIGKPARVHYEVETGLYRTGLTAQTFRSAIQRVRKYPDLLRVEGLCTHLAGAESFSNFYRIQKQIEVFDARSATLQEEGFTKTKRHVACSAAAFNYPEATHDLVRIGIAQYGFWPSQETYMFYRRNHPTRARRSPLHRVLCWKSRVMTIKRVPPGSFIGYGNSFQAQRVTHIAVVPAGYYHGFPRNLSNIGNVLIHGRRCRVLGTVNMNAISVDISDVPNVKFGDEVVLLGEQGDEELTVGAFGENTHLLNYEVLTRLPSDLCRIVVE
jgi:alanine racemase